MKAQSKRGAKQLKDKNKKHKLEMEALLERHRTKVREMGDSNVTEQEVRTKLNIISIHLISFYSY